MSLEVSEIRAERQKLQEDTHVLANETLPKLNADKGGTLELTVRDARNIEVDGDVRFLVEIMPGTVVADNGDDQVELTEVGATARFDVTSLEAKVVVHFGPSLDHYVRIPLNSKYKEQDLAQLSDWHSSAAGEETETPEIRDMTGVPQIQLYFKFIRKNRDDILKCTEQLKELQDRISHLNDRERELTTVAPAKKSALSSRSNGFTDISDDDGTAKPTNGALMIWRILILPIVYIPKVGYAVGVAIWNRRALSMFIAGVAFFHFRGDDMAV